VLDLKGTVVSDVTSLLRLPKLECLTVDSLRSARDLHQLRGILSLKTLKIGTGGPVDLGGLAGMKNLTIMVQLGNTIKSEHLLDPSVTVRKVDLI
jgi:hypothetical protein